MNTFMLDEFYSISTKIESECPPGFWFGIQEIRPMIQITVFLLVDLKLARKPLPLEAFRFPGGFPVGPELHY